MAAIVAVGAAHVAAGEHAGGQQEAHGLGQVNELPHPNDDRDRFRQPPPRDEPEDLAPGAIEPLGAVNQAPQRPLLGDLSQQAERGQRDQEPVGRISGRDARTRRSACPAAAPEGHRAGRARRAQLMQASERQLHLGFRPGDLGESKKPAACRAAYRSNAVFPARASPRITSAALWPPRTFSSSRSRASRSLVRPRHAGRR